MSELFKTDALTLMFQVYLKQPYDVLADAYSVGVALLELCSRNKITAEKDKQAQKIVRRTSSRSLRGRPTKHQTMCCVLLTFCLRFAYVLLMFS